MVFCAGLIPTFLVVKDLGLLDTYWALILPLAINPFSLIIIKNFFQELPKELEESAKIDGAGELAVLPRHRAAAVEAGARDLRPVLRGRHLERLHVAAALPDDPTCGPLQCSCGRYRLRPA